LRGFGRGLFEQLSRQLIFARESGAGFAIMAADSGLGKREEDEGFSWRKRRLSIVHVMPHATQREGFQVLLYSTVITVSLFLFDKK